MIMRIMYAKAPISLHRQRHDHKFLLQFLVQQYHCDRAVVMALSLCLPPRQANLDVPIVYFKVA